MYARHRRDARYGFVRMSRAVALIASVLVLAGCSGLPVALPLHTTTKPACDAGTVKPLGTTRVAYAASAANGTVAYRTPHGGRARAFRRRPTSTTTRRSSRRSPSRSTPHCKATWYRVQLPIKPNGITGWVPARDIALTPVRTRIVVDVSKRTLTLYRAGKVVLRATVAVGAAATPTPTGRYYVNQRLIPDSPNGPYGPAAIGVSAYSNVLTGWVQGGPIGDSRHERALVDRPCRLERLHPAPELHARRACSGLRSRERLS